MQETVVEVLAIRDDRRIARLRAGVIALAEFADRKGLPERLRDSFNSLPSDGPRITDKEIFPTILERERRAGRVLDCRKKKLLNSLVGGYRKGFDATGFTLMTFQADVIAEHKRRFPNDFTANWADEDARVRCIQAAANDESGPGLYETFNHWTDLALEMWGDLIDPSTDFRVGLMVIGVDAYAFSKTRNVGLHRYWDKIPAWRNLFIGLLISGSGGYNQLAGGEVGEIADESPLGKFIRSRRLCPTNAVAHFRGRDDAKGSLPREALYGRWSTHQLAYQVFLLNPQHVLVLGEQAPYAVEVAYRILDASGIKRPKAYHTAHPSLSGFWREQSRSVLKTLSKTPPV